MNDGNGLSLRCGSLSRKNELPDLICIVDDDASYRTGITRLLRLRGFNVAEFALAEEFLEAVRKGTVPSCLLLDVRLPGLSGSELQEQLADLGRPFPIIFLTGFEDAPTTVRAIKAGAEDFLIKPVSEQTLIESINGALRHLRSERSKREWQISAYALLKSLTPREREVFDRVVLGKSNKQTGSELGITERTIKAHRQRVFEKLKARTLADLVSLAERLGLIRHAVSIQPPSDYPAREADVLRNRG